MENQMRSVSRLMLIGLIACLLPLTAHAIRAVYQSAPEEPSKVRFHPKDNKLFMVVEYSGRVSLYDLENWEKRRRLLTLSAAANDAVFSHDGKIIATAGRDGTLRLWDLNGKQQGKPFKGHTAPVITVSFSPDGKTLASSSRDGTVRVWDLEGRQKMDAFEEHEGWVYQAVFSADGKSIVSSDSRGKVLLWLVDGKHESISLPGHEEAVYAVSRSPSGKVIATADRKGTIRLWSSAGKPLREAIQGHSGLVNALAFSPDGQILASAGVDGVVKLWNRYGRERQPPLKGHETHIISLAFSPDGQTLASAGNDASVRFWTFAGNLKQTPVKAVATAIAVAPDGSTLVYADNKNQLNFLTKEGEHKEVIFSRHPGGVGAITFITPEYMVTGGNSGELIFWEKNKSNRGAFSAISKYALHKSAITALAFPLDRRIIASADKKGSIFLSFLETKKSIKINAHADKVRTLAFSPDGNILASASLDGTVRFWNLEGKPMGEVLDGHYLGVYSIAYSPDGEYLVTADGKNLRICKLQKQYKITGCNKYPNDAIKSIVFVPGSNTFVTAGTDATVQLWGLDGRAIGPALKGHSWSVDSIAFFPDGLTLASVGPESIRLWDFKARSKRSSNWILKNERSPALSVLAEDGLTMFTASNDRVIRQWRLGERPGNIHLYKNKRRLNDIDISVDGNTLVWGADDDAWLLTVGNIDPKEDSKAGESTKLTRVSYSYATDVAVSVDGNTVASFTPTDNPQIHLISGSSAIINVLNRDKDKNNIEQIKIPMVVEQPTAMAMSPDGQLTAVWGKSGFAYQSTNGKELNNFPQEYGRVFSGAFSPDGQLLATGAANGKIGLWPPYKGANRDAILFEGHKGAVTALTFLSDGMSLLSAGDDGFLKLWDYSNFPELLTNIFVGQTIHNLQFSNKRIFATLQSGDIQAFALEQGELYLKATLVLRGDAALIYTPDGNHGFIEPQNEQGLLHGYPDGFHLYDAQGRELDNNQTVGYRDIHYALSEFTGHESLWAMMTQTVVQSYLTASTYYERLNSGVKPIFWLVLFWVFAVLFLFTVWLFIPRKLAQWAMTREDRVEIPLPSQVVKLITFIKVLGHSRRPLQAWLRFNYMELYARHFDRRNPVNQRSAFADLGTEQRLTEIVAEVGKRRLLRLWLSGPGGAGKSTLAFEVVRRCFSPSESGTQVLPLLIDEDWSDALVAQLRTMLTVEHRVPTEKMVLKLALYGNLMLLFDALSERSVDNAEQQVMACFENNLFQYVLVTSRSPKPDSPGYEHMQAWQPGHLSRDNMPAFVSSYQQVGLLVGVDSEEAVAVLDKLLGERPHLNPLFAWLALKQLAAGKKPGDSFPLLINDYLEVLRQGDEALSQDDFRRALEHIAFMGFKAHLSPSELAFELVRGVLESAHSQMRFTLENGNSINNTTLLIQGLEKIGVISRTQVTRNIQFTYDPVAEYLTAFYMCKHDSEDGVLDVAKRLRENEEHNKAFLAILAEVTQLYAGEMGVGTAS